MRIVNRTEFLELPKFTMFRKYAPTYLNVLCIKLESTEFNDFYYIGLDDIECKTNNVDMETTEIFDQAANDSTFEFNADFDAYIRDGFFDNDQLFAVYSNEEMIKLGKLLLSMGGHEND